MAKITGSGSLLTSVANTEVVPATPAGWINAYYSFYKFVFTNDIACTIKINGGSPIYLAAGQGFTVEKGDLAVTSFVIVTATVKYTWVGYYY